MDKKQPFYGTPLSRLLQDEGRSEDETATNRTKRINRLNKQQTVRDDQGRQRFHGAFTGGFSAGYFNSVASIGGFQPKQFLSSKGNRKDGQNNQFSHKPEDYMDDEDLGEFGIAPKKIRITNQYSDTTTTTIGKKPARIFAGSSCVKPQTTSLSIGERILNRMNAASDQKQSHLIETQALQYVPKNNYHGLGYKPLDMNRGSTATEVSNPLIAMLEKDKRKINISGEAFGSGVLEDEDEDYLGNVNAYGYDSMCNYEFNRSFKRPDASRRLTKMNQISTPVDYNDYDRLPGFILAKKMDNLHLGADIMKSYPPPQIEADWKMPSRSPVDNLNLPHLDEFRVRQSKNEILNKKFVLGTTKLLSFECKETKGGLVSHSDLKVTTNPSSNTNNQEEDDDQEKLNVEEATIVRQTFEWRPCSLLCKRFNVPNPFPDNSFCGLKPQANVISSTTTSTENVDQPKLLLIEQLAPLELRKSIFDIEFPILASSQLKSEKKKVVIEVDETDSEDEPQIVELDEEELAELDERSGDLEEDIVVLPTKPKQEPEVIVLSSSSSSSNSSVESSQEEQLDEYGPPLPPTLKTLISTDQQLRSRGCCDSLSKPRKRSKSKKKHKR